MSTNVLIIVHQSPVQVAPAPVLFCVCAEVTGAGPMFVSTTAAAAAAAAALFHSRYVSSC